MATRARGPRIAPGRRPRSIGRQRRINAPTPTLSGVNSPLAGILRNWSLLGSTQVIASLVAMALTIVVSRTLGDAEFGRLYFALTLAALAGVVADAGLTQVVTRAVARDHTVARPYLRRAAIVVVAVGLVAYAALVAIVTVARVAPDVALLVLVFGVQVVVEAFAQLLGGVFAGHERMVVPATTRVAANVIVLALVVPLLRFGAVVVPLALLFGGLLRIAVQLIALRSLAGFRGAAGGAPAWRELVRTGAPFMATQGLGLFVVRVDVLILARVASDASVGWYGAATRLTEALNVLPIVLVTATLPVLSRLWSADREAFGDTLRRMVGVVLVIAIPLAITLFVLAQDLVGALLTLSGYGPTVPIVRVQAAMLPFVFVDYLLVCALLACGRERRWLAIVATACVFVPLLDLAGIAAANARFANGGLGAAAATLVVELILLVAILRALPARAIDAVVLRGTAQALALGGAQAGLLILARDAGVPWIAAAALGALAYGLAALRLGLMPADVLGWLTAAVRRRSAARSPDAPEVEPGVEAA